MKAIILAAGMGSRLQGLLKGKPKPLFELGDRSLLEHSLDGLASNGIKDITIAIGFNGQEIINKIGRRPDIRYVYNESYADTGSMHSFYEALREPKDCLVLDGDIVYDPSAIRELLKTENPNSVVLTNCCGGGDEVYVSLDGGGAVKYLGKERPCEKEVWEFTGMSRFSKRFVSQMFKLHEENLKKRQQGEYYEDCACRAGRSISWQGVVIKGLAWSEVDKREDIPRAVKVLEAIRKN
jgi:choline kinase